MRPSILALLCAAPMALAATAWSQADHLIMSEVLMNAPGTEDNVTSAEFVEIFNPTASGIDLTNVYITDIATYHTLPASPAGIDGAAASDNLLRFPSGTILPSGGVAVVTCSATRFLEEYFTSSLANYGVTASKLLFETSESDGAVPNMASLHTNAGAGALTNFSRTNAGEFLVLFQWDGASDLVQDLDIVVWGAPTGGNAYTNKGGVTVDGPDGDATATAYAAEAGSTAGLSIASTAPEAMERTTINEPSEANAGGNGATGHDETTEVVASSWTSLTGATVTPGTTTLTPVLPTAVEGWQEF